MGSPSQDGVNPGEVTPGENRQISGSPSGAPSPVYLSLRKQTLLQHHASNRADKAAKNGIYPVIARSNLKLCGDCRAAYSGSP